MKQLKVCWLSAGVSSFIAGYLERDTIDKYVYIDIADQHPDSLRFIKDCEKLLGKETEIIRSEEFENVEAAARAAGIIGNVRTGFAPCTAYLKKRVRRKWEQEHADYEMTYVWGFDLNEKHRAERMVQSEIEYNHLFPLIDRHMIKQDVHALCKRLGVKRPAMYDLGYNNNNCVGCVKGGMGYWNKIRVDFPEVFAARAKLERDLGSSCLKQCYLDELDPTRGKMSDEIEEDCSIFCLLAEDEQNT